MLKISIVDSGAQRRLVLEGAVVPHTLLDLRTAWLRACAGRQGRRIVLVFRNVTYISAEGEAALWDLMNRGVRFSSRRVPSKHNLEQLIRKDQPAGIGLHFSVSPNKSAWFESLRRCSEHEMLNSDDLK